MPNCSDDRLLMALVSAAAVLTYALAACVWIAEQGGGDRSFVIRYQDIPEMQRNLARGDWQREPAAETGDGFAIQFAASPGRRPGSSSAAP